MTINGRTILFKENFTTQLALIQEYASQYNVAKTRKLTTRIANYALDIIAPNPYTFAEFDGRPTPEKMYRRAVFMRKYIIIYKTTDVEVVFLAVYHTSQNPDNISLGE